MAADGEQYFTDLLLGHKIKLKDTRNRVTYNYSPTALAVHTAGTSRKVERTRSRGRSRDTRSGACAPSCRFDGQGLPPDASRSNAGPACG